MADDANGVLLESLHNHHNHHQEKKFAMVNRGMSYNSTGSSERSTPNGHSDDVLNGGEITTSCKLFVGGLSWQTSNDRLKEYFGEFGNVTDVLIMKDPVTQRSRGFGFITFSDSTSIEKVLKIPVHMLDGKKIDPKHATPKKNQPRLKEPSNKTKKIFVGGVGQDTTVEEVKSYFSKFGKVEDTIMLMDQQTKRHRGFGFVTFENENVVDQVCEIHFHTIKNKKVESKKAQPKETVAINTQLFSKRLMMFGAMRMPSTNALNHALAAPPPPVSSLAHVQAAAAAAAAAVATQQAQNVQAAIANNYGKFYGGGFHQFATGYRFSPYPIPAGVGGGVGPAGGAPPAPGAASAALAAAQPTQVNPAAAAAAAAYQSYNLANVDMSNIQSVDWASAYPVYHV